MMVQEWVSWRREAEGNIETWLGFTVTQDLSCFARVCETLLERMNLKQWQSKRRLSTTFNSFDNELKTKVNAVYVYLCGDDQILPEDRDIAKIYNDLLDCWLRGAKYILSKEALGLELA